MNQTRNGSFRTNESVTHSFFHSCLGRIITLAAILAVLFVIARISIPDQETMTLETEDNIRQCIQANDSIKTDNIDEVVNNIGYTFTHVDSTFSAEDWEAFNKYNKLEYHKHSFYATMHVHNNIHPQGSRVGFGIFGLVVPTVNYSDLLLRVGTVHKGYGKGLIQKTTIQEEYFGDNASVQEYHYQDDKTQ